MLVMSTFTIIPSLISFTASQEDAPIRLQRKAFERAGEALRRSAFPHGKQWLKFLVVSIFAGLAVLFYILTADAGLPTELARAASGAGVHNLGQGTSEYLLKGILLLMIVWYSMFLGIFPASFLAIGKAYRRLSKASSIKQNRPAFLALCGKTQVLLIVPFILLLLYRYEFSQDITARLEEAGFPLQAYSIDEAEGRASFDLRGIQPNERRISLFNELRTKIQTLYLNDNWPVIDLAEFPNIKTLDSGAIQIKNLENSNLRNLNLKQNCTGIDTLRSESVISLTVEGSCDLGRDFGVRFPNLAILWINEETARGLDREAAGFRQELKVTVVPSPESPAKRVILLDWLTPQMGNRFVLELYGNWITDRTENLTNVKKLRLILNWPMSTRDGVRLLLKLSSLKQLRLIIPPQETELATSEFLVEFRDRLADSFAHLEVLEIERPDNDIRVLRADDREQFVPLVEKAISIGR
jgi:hypothetical protein